MVLCLVLPKASEVWLCLLNSIFHPSPFEIELGMQGKVKPLGLFSFPFTQQTFQSVASR